MTQVSRQRSAHGGTTGLTLLLQGRNVPILHSLIYRFDVHPCATFTAAIQVRAIPLLLDSAAPVTPLLPTGHALGVHVERIDRVACCHEQPVAVAYAEADVSGAFGQRNEADRLAGRIEYLDAVERRAHAPAAPQVAVDVDPKSVRRFFFFAVDEHAAIGELRSAVEHIKDVDCTSLRRALDNIELRFVGREGEPVRSLD